MASSGPRYAGTGESIDTSINASWGNPDRISTDDNSFTTGFSNGTATDTLKATNFGFSIPDEATIEGIVVEIEAKNLVPPYDEIRFNSSRIVKGGTILTTDVEPSTILTAPAVIYTKGSPTELWGTTWTPADINASDFGYAATFIRVSGGVGAFAYVDFIRITVYYTGGSQSSAFIPSVIVVS